MKISPKALLFILLTSCPSRVTALVTSYKFSDKGSLIDAVLDWINNRDQAEVEYGHINTWDVSDVTDMSALCYDYTYFNEDISAWDTSKVTDMSTMFSYTSFNQDLSSWNTSQVTDMSTMFDGTTSFNQDLSAWDISKVTNLTGMFIGVTSFNQPLSSWDTSNVKDMKSMFYGSTSFNQDLSSWDISKVIYMQSMFSYAISFNQTLCWDISEVIDTYSMFEGTPNGRISDCSKPTSIPSSKPTSSPTKRCIENKEAKFLNAVEMRQNDFISVMRSCEWLQKQKRAIRKHICNRDSLFNSPTAKKMCKVTCKMC